MNFRSFKNTQPISTQKFTTMKDIGTINHFQYNNYKLVNIQEQFNLIQRKVIALEKFGNSENCVSQEQYKIQQLKQHHFLMQLKDKIQTNKDTLNNRGFHNNSRVLEISKSINQEFSILESKHMSMKVNLIDLELENRKLRLRQKLLNEKLKCEQIIKQKTRRYTQEYKFSKLNRLRQRDLIKEQIATIKNMELIQQQNNKIDLQLKQVLAPIQNKLSELQKTFCNIQDQFSLLNSVVKILSQEQ